MRGSKVSVCLITAAMIMSAGALFITTAVVEGADFSSALSASTQPDNIYLSWEFPESYGGYTIVGVYYLYRSSSPQQLDETIAQTTDLQYSDYTISPGVTYYYTVLALYTNGVNTVTYPSNQISVTTINVPGAPTDVRASPYDGEIWLSWSAPSDDGGAPVISYNLYYTHGDKSDWSGPIKVEATATLLQAYYGLQNGETYYFFVTAVNAVGEGEASTLVSATPEKLVIYPTPPTDVKATPGDGNISLSWKSPADDGGKTIVGYYLFWSNDPKNLVPPLNVGPEYGVYAVHLQGTSYLHTGLENGRTYYYLITSYIEDGSDGDFSDIVSATPQAKPLPQITVPIAPDELNATPGSGQVQLTWSEPSNDGGSPITGYMLYWSQDVDAAFTGIPVAGTSYLHTGLEDGKTYYYTVAAVNQAGEGELANLVNATVVDQSLVPSAPTNLIASADEDAIELSWDAPLQDGGSPILEYTISRGNDSSNLTQIATVTSTTFVDSSSNEGIEYFYQVTAKNSNGLGQSSSVVTASIDTAASSSTLPMEYLAIAGVGGAAVIGAAALLLKKKRRP